jgi:hypothetical protein
MHKGAKYALVAVFLTVIFAIGLIQAALELRQGKRPGVAAVLTRRPTEATLRAFEKDLEDASWFAQAVRPWMQYAQYVALKDAGDEALAGRDGWLFYKPGVQYLTQAAPKEDEAVAAITSFRDKLRARNIHLLVVPVPGKASVYPEMLTARAANLQQPTHTHTRATIAALQEEGVEVIDLAEAFSRKTSEDYYLAQDTHWTPHGMRLAANVVAERLLALKWIETGKTEYTLQPISIQRMGDVLRMMQAPQIERRAVPEEVQCTQVVNGQTGAPYQDDAASEVLVLGDSFLRIYESDEPGSGGFIAHLARELQLPLASIVNDGGASTLVRQELSHKPALLKNKRVVIWEFVERDIRFGTEGWQDVPLP